MVNFFAIRIVRHTVQGGCGLSVVGDVQEDVGQTLFRDDLGIAVCVLCYEYFPCLWALVATQGQKRIFFPILMLCFGVCADGFFSSLP